MGDNLTDLIPLGNSSPSPLRVTKIDKCWCGFVQKGIAKSVDLLTIFIVQSQAISDEGYFNI